MASLRHHVIIGNGIAGITAARHLRKLTDDRITVISSESTHFFSRTALMYVYMGHLRYQDIKPYEDHFWAKNRIDLVHDRVEKVDFAERSLSLKSGNPVYWDTLLLATGSVTNTYNWPGQHLKGVQGLYSLQDLEAMDRASINLQRAVIVGGGLIGIEMAEMFHTRNIPVTFLVRESSYWNNVLPSEESAMVNREILAHGIDLRLNTELEAIEDNGKGHVAAAGTSGGERIPCGFVGLTTGVQPNIAFLSNSGLDIDKGILVDKNLATSIPGVYAAGDCAQLRSPDPFRKAIEPIWYTGRIMGETAAYNMVGRPVTYNPGIWFNSAKFFTIEYQVYGDVLPDSDAHHESLHWEHSSGKTSVRIVYQKESQIVRGFLAMGYRLRHEVCDRWISEQATLERVLGQFELAEFEPEFGMRVGHQMRAQYTGEFNITLDGQARRGWNGVSGFLRSGARQRGL